MLNSLRQLVVLLAAAGAAAPPLAASACQCRLEQLSQVAPHSAPAAAESGARAACCSAEQGVKDCHQAERQAGAAYCPAPGGCDCEGCDGGHSPTPQIIQGAQPAAPLLVATASYAAAPVSSGAFIDSAMGVAVPHPRCSESPGVRRHAMLCVWII